MGPSKQKESCIELNFTPVNTPNTFQSDLLELSGAIFMEKNLQIDDFDIKDPTLDAPDIFIGHF